MLDSMVSNTISVLQKYWQVFLLKGVGYTLQLTLIAVIFGVLFGALVTMLRRSRIAPLRWVASVYVEVIRGTPILLQLYFFYLMIPQWFSVLNLSKFTCVALALSFNSAAYVSEVIRSGIQAVDRGQTEAARSLGLNARQTMLRVVMPQAVKNILPALGNEFVMMLKETSLASTFLIGDLMTSFKTVSGATYLVLEPLIVVGFLYFVMTFCVSKLVGGFERRMAKHD